MYLDPLLSKRASCTLGQILSDSASEFTHVCVSDDVRVSTNVSYNHTNVSYNRTNVSSDSASEFTYVCVSDDVRVSTNVSYNHTNVSYNRTNGS